MAAYELSTAMSLLILAALLTLATAADTKKLDVSNAKIFTDAEIAQFDGSDPDKPLYMAVKGVVFDVSIGKDFYAKGASYNALVGKDATRAVAKMSLDASDLNSDISDLSQEQLEFLDKIFEGTYKSKYPVVGYMDYIVSDQARKKSHIDDL